VAAGTDGIRHVRRRLSLDTITDIRRLAHRRSQAEEHPGGIQTAVARRNQTR
jgi:hypothetical protein